MEFNLCILLYSKYSSNSKKLIDYISNSNVDLVNFLKLHTICVDNEEIRKYKRALKTICTLVVIRRYLKSKLPQLIDKNSYYYHCDEFC